MTHRTLIAVALAAFLAAPAYAHDPKEHEKEAAAAKARPDCAKLKTMDLSKLDPNDPVVKALKAKCEPAAHADHGNDKDSRDDKQDEHGDHR
ncbi:MAG TPA: hypothetical protein VM555_04180 [Tahibacter sp.]|nr:hypothetical protein [Tahibacter sp.]